LAKGPDSATIVSLLLQVATAILIAFIVSVAVVRYFQRTSTYYVFDLKSAVNTIKKNPDFERRLSLIEERLNTYKRPVFIAGAILNMENPNVEDITDEILAQIANTKRP